MEARQKSVSTIERLGDERPCDFRRFAPHARELSSTADGCADGREDRRACTNVDRERIYDRPSQMGHCWFHGMEMRSLPRRSNTREWPRNRPTAQVNDPSADHTNMDHAAHLPR